MSELITFLKQGDIFYQFTQTQLELVANLCLEKTFAAGETIFEENSSSKERQCVTSNCWRKLTKY